jgi:hypothetical protein
MSHTHSIRRAVLERDAALRRLRRLTGGLIAGAVALTGVFTGVAASSTHPRKLVRAGAHPRVRRAVSTPPLPPLPAAPESASAPPPAPVPAPPAQAPTPAQAPPVVVSGGS